MHRCYFPVACCIRYQAYRKKEEEARQARQQRNKERLEKMARGEAVGPEEREPEEEIGLGGLVKFLLLATAVIMLAGHFITGDYLWDYQGKYRHLKTFWPVRSFLASILMRSGSCRKRPGRRFSPKIN